MSWSADATPASTPASHGGGNADSRQAMLPPQAAWRMLRRRTGGNISLATFYRWLENGKVFSIRVGYHIFIPRSAVEEVIDKCLSGRRL